MTMGGPYYKDSKTWGSRDNVIVYAGLLLGQVMSSRLGKRMELVFRDLGRLYVEQAMSSRSGIAIHGVSGPENAALISRTLASIGCAPNDRRGELW